MTIYNPSSACVCDRPSKIMLNGHLTSVPCGHCVPCLLRSTNRKTFNLNEFTKRFNYGVFFTLTYNTESLPLVSYFYDDIGHLHLRPIGRFADDCPYSPILLNYNLPHTYRNISRSSYSIIGDCFWARDFSKPEFDLPSPTDYPNSHVIGVLNYLDMYRFKKRLRSKIHYYFNKGLYASEDYSIFYVGEYGTKFKRPHFHVLFLCNDASLVSNLGSFRDVIYSCWSIPSRAGRKSNSSSDKRLADYITFTTEFEVQEHPNFSYINCANSQSTNYISSYISLSQNLPYVLSLRPWQPKQVAPRSSSNSYRFSSSDVDFLFHQLFTFSSLQNSYKSTLQFFTRSFQVQDKQGLFLQYDIQLSHYCISSFFPRPFQTLPLSNSQLFTCFSRLLRILQKSTSHLVDLINSRDFSRILNIELRKLFGDFYFHYSYYFLHSFRTISNHFLLSDYGILDYLYYSSLYYDHIRPSLTLCHFYTDIQEALDVYHLNPSYLSMFYDLDSYTSENLLKSIYNCENFINYIPIIRKSIDETLYLHYKKHYISNF